MSPRGRMYRLRVRLSLLRQIIRWGLDEVFTDPVGRQLSFPNYLANQILAEKLHGRGLEAALLLLMRHCTKEPDSQVFQILAYRHASSLPLQRAGNQTLIDLYALSKRGIYEENVTICRAIAEEIFRRAKTDPFWNDSEQGG